jgi:hypothetical protein
MSLDTSIESTMSKTLDVFLSAPMYGTLGASSSPAKGRSTIDSSFTASVHDILTVGGGRGGFLLYLVLPAVIDLYASFCQSSHARDLDNEELHLFQVVVLLQVHVRQVRAPLAHR